LLKTVTLSEAKGLACIDKRFFASLRMTKLEIIFIIARVSKETEK
jgi:hypothetical protein